MVDIPVPYLLRIIEALLEGKPVPASKKDPQVRLAEEWEPIIREALNPSSRPYQSRQSGRFPIPETGWPPKKKRKASAYNKRYGKCFKKLAPKYKKKNGGWKKDGFKRCSKAARKCAKK